ncbi:MULTISPECIES: hypothetical protein [Archaeoglobus]|uniref:Uncharacterized protein n=2 Tax=Archaeoglobus fulgidus TaxID=2234 RepID=A0A075WH43_ARCFL|nr:MULTISPECIES: hypothetical protein [Archaeoglobus]AIG96898.1 hypothetical protein AFULGI_00000520 [Archaeoglobus fulgidus DSM 8774]KUJ94603.1 MAG: hypothetical protein XD40_0167 [Archaeoglobus fulgidus]KUK07493.1 MAG: Uncharacterized protein XD48_0272 [Archaeoglobus fulgidus]MDI3497085.1 hypothetical protein [Archaeoglobus sp.]
MYRYPVEVIADTYLSKVGGYSYELDRNEIGINVKALEMNTSIIANETLATLKRFEEIRPYFLRRKFVVVGIEESMDCYEMSANGEVVLPEEMEGSMEVGESVIVNTVEAFRIDGDYSNVIKAIKWRLDNQILRN